MLGATGKLGWLLRAAWPDGPVTLSCQGRQTQPDPGWVCLDPLGDPGGLIAAMRDVDCVLNLAGPVPRGRDVDLSLHARLALAVLRAGRRAGLRQVFLVSSAAVYGAANGPCAEHTPPAPISDYGRAKLRMEEEVAEFLATAQGAPHTKILRIGNVVGADQLLGQPARPDLTLDRFPDGCAPRRSYIGPKSLARILAELVTVSARKSLPPVLNVAAPGSVGMDMLLQAARRGWTYRAAPSTALHDVTLDTRLLRQFVGLAPEAATATGMIAEWRSLDPGHEASHA